MRDSRGKEEPMEAPSCFGLRLRPRAPGGEFEAGSARWLLVNASGVLTFQRRDTTNRPSSRRHQSRAGAQTSGSARAYRGRNAAPRGLRVRFDGPGGADCDRGSADGHRSFRGLAGANGGGGCGEDRRGAAVKRCRRLSRREKEKDNEKENDLGGGGAVRLGCA